MTALPTVGPSLAPEVEPALVERTLLLADLIAGYTLLAAWQAKHRSEFPRHGCAGEIEARSDPQPGYEFGASVWASEHAAERFALHVTGYGSTVREAVESATTGANAVVAENRSEWK